MYGFNFTYELRSEGLLVSEIDGRCIVDVDGTYELMFEAVGGKLVAIPEGMAKAVEIDIRDRYWQELAEARGQARSERVARDRLAAAAFRSDVTAASMMSMEPVFKAMFRRAGE